MRTYPSGYYRILANNKQFYQIDLNKYECSSYDGNDYRDLLSKPFDYAEAFQCIIDTLKANHSSLTVNLNFGSYVAPKNKVEFHKSLLWTELGFDVSEDFEILMTIKEFEIGYYMTFGQKAGSVIHFDKESVLHDYKAITWNALDSLIFDWGLYDENGEQLSGRDVLQELVEISLDYDGEDLKLAVKDYCSKLFHQIIEDNDIRVDPTSVFTEEEIQEIIKTIENVQEESDYL